jgi:hypothetical protein
MRMQTERPHVHKALEQAFKKKHSDFRLHFGRAVHPDILKGMLEGKVYSYRIVTYNAPSDLTDFIKKKGPTKHVGKITVAAEARHASIEIRT